MIINVIIRNKNNTIKIIKYKLFKSNNFNTIVKLKFNNVYATTIIENITPDLLSKVILYNINYNKIEYKNNCINLYLYNIDIPGSLILNEFIFNGFIKI